MRYACLARGTEVHLLTPDQLGDYAHHIETGGQREPCALQGYLHPVNNTRYVATYSEEQHNKFVWDISGYSYTAVYHEPSADNGLHPHPGRYGYDPQEQVPEGVQISIWQQVESLLEYMSKAHGLRIQGIVAEFIQNESGKVFFHSIVEVTWASGAALWKGLVSSNMPKSAVSGVIQPAREAPAQGIGRKKKKKKKLKRKTKRNNNDGGAGFENGPHQPEQPLEDRYVQDDPNYDEEETGGMSLVGLSHGALIDEAIGLERSDHGDHGRFIRV